MTLKCQENNEIKTWSWYIDCFDPKGRCRL